MAIHLPSSSSRQGRSSASQDQTAAAAESAPHPPGVVQVRGIKREKFNFRVELVAETLLLAKIYGAQELKYCTTLAPSRCHFVNLEKLKLYLPFMSHMCIV